jgi:hypothetical protein
LHELIVLLAHKLKLKVSAEGVETAKHWKCLRELGCDLGQWEFFSQPVEPEAAGKVLRGRSHLPHASKAGAQSVGCYLEVPSLNSVPVSGSNVYTLLSVETDLVNIDAQINELESNRQPPSARGLGHHWSGSWGCAVCRRSDSSLSQSVLAF